MTLSKIAQAAGVSISTVSRVVNAEAGVSDSTVQLVRRAMRSMDIAAPKRRRNSASGAQSGSAPGGRIAFYVLAANKGVTPAYDKLLRGVSAAAQQFQLDLHVGFVDDPEAALEQISHRRPDGLVMHGLCPPPERARTLYNIPTVWLMGNAIRPSWGDQVMPDNVQIGRIAAKYLLGRGHHNTLYFGFNTSWSLTIRAMSFAGAVEELGGTSTVINPPNFDAYEKRLQLLVETYLSAAKRPTGLFVAEDWVLRSVYDAFTRAGIRPGSDLDIISCNNDRPHLLGLTPTPATIDIHFERIAYRGVERLVARMQRDDLDDRITLMLEPTLVPAPDVLSAWPT